MIGILAIFFIKILCMENQEGVFGVFTWRNLCFVMFFLQSYHPPPFLYRREAHTSIRGQLNQAAYHDDLLDSHHANSPQSLKCLLPSNTFLPLSHFFLSIVPAFLRFLWEAFIFVGWIPLFQFLLFASLFYDSDAGYSFHYISLEEYLSYINFWMADWNLSFSRSSMILVCEFLLGLKLANSNILPTKTKKIENWITSVFWISFRELK